jgi:hypothetical protein
VHPEQQIDIRKHSQRREHDRLARSGFAQADTVPADEPATGKAPERVPHWRWHLAVSVVEIATSREKSRVNSCAVRACEAKVIGCRKLLIFMELRQFALHIFA